MNNSAKFIEASKKGNLIPLYKCVFSDHLTPVLAYRCLVKEDDRESPSFLFESVEPGSTTSSVVRIESLLFSVNFISKDFFRAAEAGPTLVCGRRVFDLFLFF